MGEVEEETTTENNKPSQDVEDEITKNNVEVMMRTDEMQVPGQKFALVSFVSPEGSQKYQHIGMKIRGVFKDKSDADEHAKRLMESDDLFDIYVVDMYEWLVVPPEKDLIKDQVYKEEFLNNLMGDYDKERERIRQVFEDRKEDLKSRPDVNKVAKETGLSTKDIMEAIEEKSKYKLFEESDPHPSTSESKKSEED